MQQENELANSSQNVNIGDNLNPRQKLFADTYARILNATRAAELSGYSGDYNTLAQTAHDNLNNPKIKAYLSDILARAHMGRDEVLARIESHARGSLAPFLNDDGVVDLSTDQARDNLGLLKRVEQRVAHGTRGTGSGASDWEQIDTRVEIHDPQRATELLARVHRLVSDTEINIDLSIDDSTQANSIAGLMAGALQAKDITPAIEDHSAQSNEDDTQGSALDSSDSTL